MMSTSARMQLRHMFAGFGAIAIPHVAHRMRSSLIISMAIKKKIHTINSVKKIKDSCKFVNIAAIQMQTTA